MLQAELAYTLLFERHLRLPEVAKRLGVMTHEAWELVRQQCERNLRECVPWRA